MTKCAGCRQKLTGRGVKYCNNKCQGIARSRQSVEEWKAGGRATKGRARVMKLPIRNYLIEQSNGMCVRCGWGGVHPTDGRYLLQIHHKDGDCSNDLRKNLEVLCPNCHSMTTNFGSRNKQGSSRVNYRPGKK